jgi:SAM-dependent methyltransferase
MDKMFYRVFEERFRGSSDLIKSRLEIYLPFLEPLKLLYGLPQALDLGCGRGEWLSLLQDRGFQATGVDFDEGMLSACRKLKLDVIQGDALTYVKKLPANSVSVVSAFHVIEHIAFDMLGQLVQEALRVLKPGGLLILETPNSENLLVGTSTFYLDPSHQRPLPAPLVSFLAEYIGFERVKTIFLQETPNLSASGQVGLCTVFEGVSPDYAIVSQKQAEKNILALFDPQFEGEYGIRLSTLTTGYDKQIETRFREQKYALENMHKEFDKLQLNTNRQVVSLANRYDQQIKTDFKWHQYELEVANKKIEQLFQHVKNLDAEFTQQRLKWEKSHDNQMLIDEKISRLNHSSHHWWAVADSFSQELKQVYASKYWRLTGPIRKLAAQIKWMQEFSRNIIRRIMAEIKKRMRLLLSKILWKMVSNRRMKNWISARFDPYPKLKDKIRRWGKRLNPRARIIFNTLQNYPGQSDLKQKNKTAMISLMGDTEKVVNDISSRAGRFYICLKKSIEHKEI